MEQPSISTQKLALGLILVVFGLLAFTDAIDLWNPRMLWRLWPLGLILLGVASEVDAFRERRSGAGPILIAIGIWKLIANQQILGLDHRSAFPLGIAVVGLFMAVHAVVDRPAAQKKETNHESC